MVDERVKKTLKQVEDNDALDFSSKYVRIPFVRELLETCKDTESYYSDFFEKRAVEIFDKCDSDGSGVLTGKELDDAVCELLPELKQEKEIIDNLFDPRRRCGSGVGWRLPKLWKVRSRVYQTRFCK